MDSFGRKLRVSVFGESHGGRLGVVIDGVPAGLGLCEDDLMCDISRRKSGAAGTTPRIEADVPEIVSGVYQGHTTGAPLTILFSNTNTRSTDYTLFESIPRPGHADYSAAVKWHGYQDPRGGGHFSGRLTLPVVAAGVVAKKILSSCAAPVDGKAAAGRVRASIVELGGIPHPSSEAGFEAVMKESEMPQVWKDAVAEAASDGDSLGAVVECRVDNLAAGYGEPFWDSVESVLSHAMFAIPGVRGVEFGDGFASAAMRGSAHNDPFGPGGIPVKNGSGGVNGGITDGAPVVLRVAFKPTASIRKPQTTWNYREGRPDTLVIPGRHDVCFALRAPVVVEAMAAISLADLVLLSDRRA